jgi:hypothetical protein
MPITNKNGTDNMTLDEAIDHLEDIKNSQATFYQDEAVKYALAVLTALRGED